MSKSSELLIGLKGQDLDDFNASYAAGTIALERIRDILIKKYKRSRERQFSKNSYESPAWSEKQADSIGEQRTLLYIINDLLPGDKING